MIESIKMTQIQKLFEDESFVSKFNNTEDFESIKKLFAENSLTLSDDELKEFLTAVVNGADQKESGELTAEEMENVAGGSFTAAFIIGGVCAVVTGTCMYKLRKVLGI